MHKPATMFLKLVHLKAILEAHFKELTTSNLDKDIERLVAIGEFNVKHCTDKRFEEIDDAMRLHSGLDPSNIKTYLQYVKGRMVDLCSDAFYEGRLPLAESI